MASQDGDMDPNDVTQMIGIWAIIVVAALIAIIRLLTPPNHSRK